MAVIPRRAVGRVEDFEVEEAPPKFQTQLPGINGLDERQRDLLRFGPKLRMTTNQRLHDLL